MPPAASNANTLVWEYPSAGPDGDPLDVVESLDIVGGLIIKHRVYWGRVEFKIPNKAAAR